MALLVANRSPVAQGQVTASIYGHIREGRYDDAIHILEWELQVNPLISKIRQPRAALKTSGFTAELSHEPGSTVNDGVCFVSS